jgi:hypothetical protein
MTISTITNRKELTEAIRDAWLNCPVPSSGDLIYDIVSASYEFAEGVLDANDGLGLFDDDALYELVREIGDRLGVRRPDGTVANDGLEDQSEGGVVPAGRGFV